MHIKGGATTDNIVALLDPPMCIISKECAYGVLFQLWPAEIKEPSKIRQMVFVNNYVVGNLKSSQLVSSMAFCTDGQKKSLIKHNVSITISHGKVIGWPGSDALEETMI